MKIIKDKEACLRKKGNMAMWDAIDNLAEDYIKKVLEYSDKEIDPEDLDEEVLMDLGKDITEMVINTLEKSCGAEFVYADCNY